MAGWEHFYNYLRPHSSLKGKTPYERFMEVQDCIPYEFDIAENFYKSNEKIKDYAMEKIKRTRPDLSKYLDA